MNQKGRVDPSIKVGGTRIQPFVVFGEFASTLAQQSRQDQVLIQRRVVALDVGRQFVPCDNRGHDVVRVVFRIKSNVVVFRLFFQDNHRDNNDRNNNDDDESEIINNNNARKVVVGTLNTSY